MLHYQVEGKGEAIVLLHGYLENLKMWKSIDKELAKQYQVVLIDLPGHGKSPVYGEIHSMELMAEKVKEVLDEIGLERVLMIGHSMGGYVCLAFAELYPNFLNGFVLLNSTTLPDSAEKKEQRLKAVQTAERNLDTLIKMSIPSLFAEQNLPKLTAEKEFAIELARETPLKGVTAALKGMRLRPDRTNLLNTSQLEIGVIIGTYDKAVNPEELKKLLPKNEAVSVVEMPTGHMSYLEAPRETLQFIQVMASRVYS